MGLIDKAIRDLGAPDKTTPASGDHDIRSRASSVNAVVNDALPRKTFEVDFKALSRQGFYAPTQRSTAIALELRVIKRRLLRRAGFFQRSQDRRALTSSGRPRNLIMVTSTRPAEGKTFTALNLALSIAAEEGISVVLADGDAPRPKIRAYFDIEDGPGLTDWAADPSAPERRFIHEATNLPLSVIGEGACDARLSELFGGADAQRMFTELSSRHPDRLVIVDAPPVLATTEASVLARHADEIIFVVEADKTPEPAVAAALDELLEVNPNVSLVLNRCLLPGGGNHYGSYERYENLPERGAKAVARRRHEGEKD